MKLIVKGFPECYYFQEAKKLARKMKREGKVSTVTIQAIPKTKFFQTHNSSPVVYKNGIKLRNGYSSLLKL